MKNRTVIALVLSALIPLSVNQAFAGHGDQPEPWIHGHGNGHGNAHGPEHGPAQVSAHGPVRVRGPQPGFDHHPDFRPAHPAPMPIVHHRPWVAAPVPGPHWGPAHYRIMPPGYKTVIAAGITYFVLNEIWYRMHDGVYQQVAAPTSNIRIINNPQPVVISSGLNVIDVNGVRYYERDGHYYRRDINGNYLEVARPSGL